MPMTHLAKRTWHQPQKFSEKNPLFRSDLPTSKYSLPLQTKTTNQSKPRRLPELNSSGTSTVKQLNNSKTELKHNSLSINKTNKQIDPDYSKNYHTLPATGRKHKYVSISVSVRKSSFKVHTNQRKGF